MEENGEDSHAMQTEENMEELKESHDAEEDAELEDAQKIAKGSERNSKKRGRKKPSGAQGTPKKPESKETPKKPESKEPITPASDRPARERKSIDRFADTIEKEKEKPKEFKIEQGAGTCLREIPNVVFKLSKHKTSDESVQLLHRLLYNKKVKPHQVKSNILQFSGCVWGPNEEKEKSKMKDKLEKCVKDNLWQVSDLLDLNITKGTRKEDLVLRVLEFLDCPHKTTEKLVQEEEQKSREKKRKKSPGKGKRRTSSGQTLRKRQKQEANEEDVEQDEVGYEDNEDDAQDELEEEPVEEPEEVPVKKKKSIKIKEPSRDAKPSSAKKQGKKPAKKSSESEDIEEDPEEPVPEDPEQEPEEAPEEPKRKRSKNKKYEDDVVSKSPKKPVQKPDVVSKIPKKVTQKAVKKKSVYEPGEEDLDDEVKEDVKSKPLSKVSQKLVPAPKEAAKTTPVGSPSKGSPSKEKKKPAGTGSSKASSKKKSKEEQEDDAPLKVPKKARGANSTDSKEIKSNAIPPDEDLRAAICELLRDADFSTVTFTDVVKQLGAKFDVDLSQNKAHVKNLIQEEISKIVDEDDGEGDNEEEAAGIHTPEKEEKESIAED